MKRLVLVAVAILTMALVPNFAAAQIQLPNLIGPGIPGSDTVQNPGWIFGGSGSFGDQFKRAVGTPNFYVGYLTDRAGTRFGFDAEDGGLAGITSIKHRYEKAGIALGAEIPFMLKNNFAFLASGWYVLPIMKKDEETYFDPVTPTYMGRKWDTANTWWYAQGALAYSIGNTAALLGFRYDFYDTKFDSPGSVWGGFPSDPDQRADVTLNNYIPFIGVQYTYDVAPTNLSVRMVGIPFLAGTAKYSQTLGNVAPGHIEGSGNWSKGYFLEAQVDYTRRMFGSGQMGVFGMWSMVHGSATVDVDGEGPFFGIPAQTDSFDLNLNRTAWTFGGKFSVDFHLPFAL
jgi:hypothetical protein